MEEKHIEHDGYLIVVGYCPYIHNFSWTIWNDNYKVESSGDIGWMFDCEKECITSAKTYIRNYRDQYGYGCT